MASAAIMLARHAGARVWATTRDKSDFARSRWARTRCSTPVRGCPPGRPGDRDGGQGHVVALDPQPAAGRATGGQRSHHRGQPPADLNHVFSVS